MSLPRADGLLLAAPLLLLTLLPMGVSSAASVDRTQDIEIDSADIEGTLADTGEVRLSGQVQIRQGSLDIRADSAVLSRVEGEVSQVVFEGAPASLKQVDDNGTPVSVRARNVTYRPASNEVLLEGAVEVDQPQGTLRGEKVRYDMASGRLRAEGESDSDRIRLRIQPRGAASGGDGSS
jgi:lipopolysaccharide export system protein LptA